MKDHRMTAIARMLGATVIALAVIPSAFGQTCTTCASLPPTNHCPPKFWHWEEGPPKLKFKHACPKPICDPCTLPHAGYYETCWNAWPWAPDWSHCIMPPTALTHEGVPADAVVPTYTPRAPSSLPPTNEPPPAAKPTGQGNRATSPVQKTIEAKPVNR
jgi:hypothetical protein